jgi:CopG family nickel-responsive transcriptional regulator
MANIERIGVSLESELLVQFDKLIAELGYQNRSEAIRDMIREKLSQKHLAEPGASGVAAVCVVYDHHSSGIAEKLTSLQHSHFFSTVSSMHIHIDHHNCLEVITLKGQISEIKKMADQIVSLKGVKLGKVNLVSLDAETQPHHHHS